MLGRGGALDGSELRVELCGWKDAKAEKTELVLVRLSEIKFFVLFPL